MTDAACLRESFFRFGISSTAMPPVTSPTAKPSLCRRKRARGRVRQQNDGNGESEPQHAGMALRERPWVGVVGGEFFGAEFCGTYLRLDIADVGEYIQVKPAKAPLIQGGRDQPRASSLSFAPRCFVDGTPSSLESCEGGPLNAYEPIYSFY